jgi:hypothetical protein
MSETEKTTSINNQLEEEEQSNLTILKEHFSEPQLIMQPVSSKFNCPLCFKAYDSSKKCPEYLMIFLKGKNGI